MVINRRVKGNLALHLTRKNVQQIDTLIKSTLNYFILRHEEKRQIDRRQESQLVFCRVLIVSYASPAVFCVLMQRSSPQLKAGRGVA